jgi:hypothetical protein
LEDVMPHKKLEKLQTPVARVLNVVMSAYTGFLEMDERFFLLDWAESSSQELSKIQQQMIVFDVCNHKPKKFPI